MTFYWWSHWFWITCLTVQLLPHAITQVHTYPSQEFSQQQQQQQQRLATTKLYQTTASQSWTISTATARNIMDLTVKTTPRPATTTTTTTTAAAAMDTTSVAATTEQQVEQVDINEDALDMLSSNEQPLEATTMHNQLEFKRSANFAVQPASQLNNYTNYSRSLSTNSSSSTTSSSTTTTSSTTSSSSSSSSTTTASPPSNSTYQAAATPATPKINTEWLSAELQKAPFTLENANKEDELRRAENEHRSRKSKELSAEYKHINRYINYSSDTKSLLARSASSAPSVAGYNTDDSNISSEALAIQRTYFLDAGAISAICFTVFGICCTVGTIGIVLYRRRYVNKPQALSEPDSSVYIDDSTMRVSDNSDEMYSLDNDSFLNSLEAMTIQNYWTDTVKHTKL